MAVQVVCDIGKGRAATVIPALYSDLIEFLFLKWKKGGYSS